MSKELDAIYATAAKVSALGAQRELADAIEQSLPHLLANEPHPWPIGLIKIYVLSKPDAHTLGWLEMHNGRRFPVLRPLDMGVAFVMRAKPAQRQSSTTCANTTFSSYWRRAVAAVLCAASFVPRWDTTNT